MYRFLFFFLLCFMAKQSFASAEFMEVLELFNEEQISCTNSKGLCSSSIRSIRCAFESELGQASEDGNCSFLNNRGQLKVVYDQVAFLLFSEVINRGLTSSFNGREFKLVLDKISCRKDFLADGLIEEQYICRISE